MPLWASGETTGDPVGEVQVAEEYGSLNGSLIHMRSEVPARLFARQSLNSLLPRVRLHFSRIISMPRSSLAPTATRSIPR